MKHNLTLFLIFSVFSFHGVPAAVADEFTQEDIDVWQAEYMAVVQKGRDLFTDPALGNSENGVICGQCHPNGANTHPETYPKFQKQIGRVIGLWEMVNWCLRNPLEAEPLDAASPDMTAIIAYMAHERRGVPLEPGKH